MTQPFKDFDFSSFWDDSEYALKEYVNEPPSDELIASLEEELGYKLPASYLVLMKMHNGGIPFNTCFPTTETTSWSEDHIAISGILGIGRKKGNSLGGEYGSQFMMDEWGYPPIGICICDCPSAGHDMIMLDYQKCGKEGEPEVVHVDQESDYRITFLAKDFETFIRGLVNEEVYDTSEEDLAEDLAKIDTGAFSDLLSKLISNQHQLDFGGVIRKISRQLTEEKGYFALHADELSYLLYDIQFFLYSKANKRMTRKEYLKAYPSMIAFGGEFSTGGYAPGFIEDWLTKRVSENQILESVEEGLLFTSEFEDDLLSKLAQYT